MEGDKILQMRTDKKRWIDTAKRYPRFMISSNSSESQGTVSV